MNEDDKNHKDESLKDLFLLTSNLIDTDTEKAKQIIRNEGLDPERLGDEGLVFIKTLQKKVEADWEKASRMTVADLTNKLLKMGLPKSLLEKKIIPSALTNWKPYYPSETYAISKYLSQIFGWNQSEIFSSQIQITGAVAGMAKFKAPKNANLNQIKAYSHYAYFLAKIVSKSYHFQDIKLPEDIGEFKRNYLKKYKVFDLESLLNYVWELGICVLPLNDSGVFHGACWNIDGKKIIVLKQNTNYHARWIFDLLHEVYHALAHLDELNSSVIETQELNPFVNNDTEEENEANTFSHKVLFGERTETILNQCVYETRGKMENLKSVVKSIALRENIREDILGNFVAFRLSLDDQNWWGPAASLQITDPNPFTLACQILQRRINTETLNPMEYSSLKIAISNN